MRRFFQLFALLLTMSLTVVAQQTKDFTVCALNVDGLPRDVMGITVNNDGPGSDGTKLISQYLASKGYDIIGVSEDFNYHGSLMTALSANYNSGTQRATLSVGGLFSGGVPFDTDGLNLIWRNTMTAQNEIWTRWESVSNTDGNQYIKKGFRHYEVALEDGMTIDVYVLHMDAGDQDVATPSRNAQWLQLANDIMSSPFARPKIVIGDTNSRWTREDIQANFFAPIANDGKYIAHDAWVELWRGANYAGLVDESGEGWGIIDNSDPTDFSKYEVVDKIIYLNPTSGNTLQLTANSYCLELDYTYGTVDESSESEQQLGDHKPCVVSFTCTRPTYDFAPTYDRWTWLPQPKVAGTLVYLFNIGQGCYNEKKGFLNKDGYMKNDPNDAFQWYLWGDLSATEEHTSISHEVDGTTYRLHMQGTGTTASVGTGSGATEMKIEDGNPTVGAYKFGWKYSGKTRFFNADGTDNNFTAAQSKTEWNDWYIIHQDQKDMYDRYIAAWEQGSQYLNTLPLPEVQKQEMATLLGQSTNWLEGTTEQLEALNAKIESWFTDYTTAMQNPSFELGTKLATNFVEGWEVTPDVTQAFSSGVVNSNDGSADRYFEGIDGNYVYNTWTPEGSPANGYYCQQTITLPEGWYRLSAVFTSGPAGNNIDLLFGTQRATFTLPERPNSIRAEKWFHHDGGSLVVGAHSETWFEADDFRLVQYEYFYDHEITSLKYATLAIGYNTIIPAGVTVYKATEEVPVGDGTIQLMLEKCTPELLRDGEGIVTYADVESSKIYRFFRTDDEAEALEGNLLSGAVNEIEVSDKQYGKLYYTFADGESNLGFYLADNDAAIEAHTAYYLTDAPNSATVYPITFEQPVITFGDINRDGHISLADVTALVEILAGRDSVVPYKFDHDAADMDLDGQITSTDLTILVALIMEMRGEEVTD